MRSQNRVADGFSFCGSSLPPGREKSRNKAWRESLEGEKLEDLGVWDAL